MPEDRTADIEALSGYIDDLESAAEWARSLRLSKEAWLAMAGRAWDRAPDPVFED